jgi:hypothetical protein
VEAQNSIDANSVVPVFAVRKRLTNQNRQSISLRSETFLTNLFVATYAAMHQKDSIYYFLFETISLR